MLELLDLLNFKKYLKKYGVVNLLLLLITMGVILLAATYLVGYIIGILDGLVNYEAIG